MLYSQCIFCQSILTLNGVMYSRFSETIFLDKEVYDCPISCLQHISRIFSIDTIFHLRFVLDIPATSELSNKLDAMFIIIFTYEYRNNFWLSRRFGRWSVCLIDVRIKEVPLYSTLHLHEITYVYVHNYDYCETDFSTADMLNCYMLCGRADNSTSLNAYRDLVCINYYCEN